MHRHLHYSKAPVASHAVGMRVLACTEGTLSVRRDEDRASKQAQSATLLHLRAA